MLSWYVLVERPNGRLKEGWCEALKVRVAEIARLKVEIVLLDKYL